MAEIDRCYRAPGEAGRWPTLAPRVHDPKALPWTGMTDAFGFNPSALACLVGADFPRTPQGAFLPSSSFTTVTTCSGSKPNFF
jgi:hypothetical protein